MSNTTFASLQAWPAAHIAAPLGRMKRRVEIALRVRQERSELKELDARALEDLGFSRSEANSEASRPFWDLPPDRWRA